MKATFWIVFIGDVELLVKEDKELNLLIKESDELTAIFTASLETLNRQKNLTS